ncbi:MAG: DNA polymerase/3'-5' exonuclease PolX [Terriglobales bacterium]
MDNKSIATMLYETADLMEIDAQDPFRIRSYRNAAEAIDGWPKQIAEIACEPKKLLEIPGIGKGMQANLLEICNTGKLQMQQDLLTKYKPTMLELLKISGLGPKTIQLIWSAFQVADVDGVEKLAKEGKLRELPRMSEKTEQKILKSIETYRSISGRFLLDDADTTAQKLIDHCKGFMGVEKITPAGSLRRGRETVGDLDILITGTACENNAQRSALAEHVLKFPGILETIAKGENKVSFRLRSGMQVDVRLLPRDSFGAAMQYFTGSKTHNVSLRQRAIRMGYTLNEYGLAKLEEDDSAGQILASKTEEDIYKKLKLAYIPPEMRENCGEIELAEKNEIPQLLTIEDMQGDVHMHTVETDGKCSIEEMATAARDRGYKYMAITDHTKNLAMANGLTDERALQHIKRIREANKKIEGIKIFAGAEVDILAGGGLDLSDEVLSQMDVVIASVHSHFNQEPEQMTERIINAIENPNTCLIGHPTGRLLLRRNAYKLDIDAILKAAAKHKVAMEHNAYADRLDLNDQHLRMAKQRGVKIVINTDSHHTSHMQMMKYGVLQARRAWLTKDDVLNTLPADKFAKAIKHGW